METRRQFIERSIFGAAALTGSCLALGPDRTAAAETGNPALRWPGGSQRRWRTAFGLNGFMSSEQEFGNSFAIWEVLEFAQREGFEGIGG